MYFVNQLKSTDETINIARFGGMGMDAPDWIPAGSTIRTHHIAQSTIRRDGFMPRANGCDGYDNTTVDAFAEIFG